MSNLQQCLAERWDHRLVQLCAHLSNWIYTDRRLPKELELIEKVQTSDKGDNTFFAVVLSEELKTLFVAYRETEVVGAAVEGFWVPELLHDTGIKVHAGFYTFAKDDASRIGALRQKIDSKKYTRICFTGHGHGGAVAMLLLIDHVLRKDSKAAVAIVFGAPMVLRIDKKDSSARTPEELVNDFRERTQEFSKRTLNFVNGNDAVPRLFGLLKFVKDHGAAAKTFLNFPPRWFKDLLDAVSKCEGDYASELASTFKHHAQLAQLKHNGQVEWITEAGLEEFSDHEQKATIFRNHGSASYLAKVTFAANEFQETNIVARLQFKVGGWLATTYSNELVLAPDHAGLSNISSSIGEQQLGGDAKMAQVVSFCGSSKAGKSFLVGTLQRRATPGAAVPSVCENIKAYEATTGDVALWRWGDDVWLLDCEGTNGTNLPKTMGEKYSKILTELKETHGTTVDRAAKVEKFFPPLCICLSSVFCYVIEQVPTNMVAYTEVCKFASAGWDLIECAVRPGLVIIHNKVEASMLIDPDELTESFLRLDASDTSKPEEQRLKSLFLDVYVVQLPAITEQNKANKFSDPKSQVVKTVQELFDDRVALLEEKVKEMITKHHDQQRRSNAEVFQSSWLKLLPCVCEAFEGNIRVSFADILPSLSERPPNVLRDVVSAGHLLLTSRLLSFHNSKDLEDKTLDVLKVVKGYAACLMARVAVAYVGADKDVTVELLRSNFNQNWSLALQEVYALLPCSAVQKAADRNLKPSPPFWQRPFSAVSSLLSRALAAPDVEAVVNLCGLPATAHDCHKSRARAGSWYDALWGGDTGAKMWEGPHELSEAVQREQQRVEREVYTCALQIMHRFKRQEERDHRVLVIEGLPFWVRDTLTPATCSSLFSCCFVCGMPFPAGSFFGLGARLWTSESLDICNDCNLVLKELASENLAD